MKPCCITVAFKLVWLTYPSGSVQPCTVTGLHDDRVQSRNEGREGVEYGFKAALTVYDHGVEAHSELCRSFGV